MAIENPSIPGASTPALLLAAAATGATGALELTHPGGESSRLWLRDGQLYAASVPGYRPALGIRLLSSGLITPEQLGIALGQQRTTMAGHRIGEVMVHLGYVRPDEIDSFVLDQVHEQVADLLDLPVSSARFHDDERIGVDTIAPRSLDSVLPVAEERRHRGEQVLAEVGGPTAVPALGPQGRGAGQSPLGPREWALLCRVDGRRDLSVLARSCGFTILEAAQLVGDLARSGLLVLPGPVRAGSDGADIIAVGAAATSPRPDPEPPGPPGPLGTPAPPGPGPADLADPPIAPGLLLEAIHEFVTDTAPPHPVGPPSPAEPALADVGRADVGRADVGRADVGLAHVGLAGTGLAGSAAGTTGDRGEPTVAPADAGEQPAAYSDTSMFMRELSSLSEDQQQVTPSVTRRAIALDGPRRRRWRWGM